MEFQCKLFSVHERIPPKITTFKVGQTLGCVSRVYLTEIQLCLVLLHLNDFDMKF